MENQAQNFNPEQSLRLINEMISKSKQNFTNMSFFFLMWGWLLFLAGIAEYLLGIVAGFEHPYIVWPVIGIAGGIMSAIYGAKMEKQAKAKSFLDRIFDYLWIAFIFTLILIIVAAVTAQVNPSPFVMILTGLPTFLTGRILKFKPLMVGGIVFWILGFLIFFVFSEYASIVFSIAIMIGYIIPGYMLRQEERKNV